MTRAEELETRRVLARYRRLILLGAVRLPLEAARRMVGPDCAYHLYSRESAPARSSARDRRRAIRPR